MTIDEVRAVLTAAINDDAGDDRLVTKTVAGFLLDSTDGYERQYADEEAANEVVVSWLDAFDDVIIRLRDALTEPPADEDDE